MTLRFRICAGVSVLTLMCLLFLMGAPTPSYAQFATNTPLPVGTAVAFPTQSVIEPIVSATAAPRITPTLSVPVAPFVDHYVFERPFERRDDLQDYVNRVYPYGGTQFGQFDVHLGADFSNGRFTPVLAVGEGVVVYSGSDLEILFGPYLDYYGNLVVIAHDILSAEGLPVYTLYGHLERIDVAAGAMVQAGDVIGTVGATGIAIGAHLHFEVRVGDPNNYLATRNPDLWIKPYPGFGTLAGRVTTREADWRGMTIIIRANGRTREAYTYGGDRVNSDPSWNENFTYGDLPAGEYEVIVSERTGRVYFRETVTISAGQTTFIEIFVDK